MSTKLMTADHWQNNPEVRFVNPARMRAQWSTRAAVESTRYQHLQKALDALVEVWEGDDEWNHTGEPGRTAASLRRQVRKHPVLLEYLPYLTSYQNLMGCLLTFEHMQEETRAAMLAALDEAERWNPIVNPQDHT